MHFEESDEGDYRIYAGVMELRGRGYIASVVVNRVRGSDKPVEAYRDDDMAAGRVWETPSHALSYALHRGRTVIRSERHRLAC